MQHNAGQKTKAHNGYYQHLKHSHCGYRSYHCKQDIQYTDDFMLSLHPDSLHPDSKRNNQNAETFQISIGVKHIGKRNPKRRRK